MRPRCSWYRARDTRSVTLSHRHYLDGFVLGIKLCSPPQIVIRIESFQVCLSLWGSPKVTLFLLLSHIIQDFISPSCFSEVFVTPRCINMAVVGKSFLHLIESCPHPPLPHPPLCVPGFHPLLSWSLMNSTSESLNPLSPGLSKEVGVA